MTCRYSRITRNLQRRVRQLENGETDVLATKQELSDFESLIDTKISSTYHPAGTKTVSELVSSLLTEEHEGEVYNISDSGLTTSDFIEGANNPIDVGDNVVVARVVSGNNTYYKFDVLAGFLDTTNFVQKSQTQGLIKNDGTIDTNQYLTNDDLVDSTIGIEDSNNHDYVEIGGMKWATMNIGASNITDFGLYFAWGETTGYTVAQVGVNKNFDWNDYELTSDNGTTMDEYNSTDNKTTLDSEDDAARVNWSGSWRMPTKDEFQTLIAATTSLWVTNYQNTGIDGQLLTDKTDNSKVLFFPAAGSCYNGHDDSGRNGYYWTSSLGSVTSVKQGWSLVFNSNSNNYSTYNRSFGYQIRAILGTVPAPKYAQNSDLATVAKTGDYNDLSNKPTIPDISGKANASEMTITPGTEANADKTTIQLKSGTSATVLTQHQDISSLIASSSVRNVVVCTQNEYDALVANDQIDPYTEYNIVEV